jgi:opacity protein-like surface antigen
MRYSYFLVAVMLVALSGWAAAQSTTGNDDYKRWNFDAGFGVAPVVGDSNRTLTTGWDFQLGAGRNFSREFGVDIEYQFNGLGVDDRVLREFNVPDGNARVWSLTLNPILRIHPEKRLSGYVIGGPGFYRRTVEFTRPTLQQGFVIDPFFGFVFPALIPADIVLGSFSENAAGFNIGGGIAYKLKDTNASLYVEPRYHWANTGDQHTALFPVTFGVRW